MSDAIKKLHDYLAKSPSVVYPEDVLAYLLAIEAENSELRELVADMWPFVEGAMDDEYCPAPKCPFTELCTENQVCMASSGFYYRMRELGVEL